MMSDPVGDSLTRIRNAYMAGHKDVYLRSTKMIKSIAQILVDNKYIQDYSLSEEEGKKNQLHIKLRYENRLPALTHIKRISKPGRRVYKSIKNLKPTLNGRGIAILTTPMGLMSDKQAKKNNIGGEVICEIW